MTGRERKKIQATKLLDSFYSVITEHHFQLMLPKQHKTLLLHVNKP